MPSRPPLPSTASSPSASSPPRRCWPSEAGRSADLGKILDQSGREPNRKALGDLLRRAQAAGFVGAGDPGRISGQFFSLLFGDLILRLLLGVIPAPTDGEVKERAEAATAAVLALHPA